VDVGKVLDTKSRQYEIAAKTPGTPEYIAAKKAELDLYKTKAGIESGIRRADARFEKDLAYEFEGKKVKGKDLLITLASERMNTGRIYIQNIDNVNKQTPFKDHLTMSNLCLSGDTMVDVRILSKLEDELLFENLEELEEGLYCGKISLEELNSIYNVFVSELDSDNRIYVLSKDIESDIIEYNLVTNSALMNESSKVIKITSELNGENVTCTESHKIFTKNRGYVLSCELKSDDTLDISGGNGGNLLIEKQLNKNFFIELKDLKIL
jgi:ribonucleotide reductase alpha subunit